MMDMQIYHTFLIRQIKIVLNKQDGIGKRRSIQNPSRYHP